MRLEESDVTRGLAAFANLPVRDDFMFHADKFRYPCPRVLACFLSEKVAKYTCADVTVAEFTVDIKDPTNQFELVMDMLKGEEMEIKNEDSLFYLFVGSQLGNSDITSIASNVQLQRADITEENVFYRLDQKEMLEVSNEDEICFIAERFERLKLRGMSCLSVDTLMYVVAHPKFKIESERSLLDFVNAMVREKGDAYKALFSCVSFSDLPRDVMSNFLKNAEVNMVPRVAMHLAPPAADSGDPWLAWNVPPDVTEGVRAPPQVRSDSMFCDDDDSWDAFRPPETQWQTPIDMRDLPKPPPEHVQEKVEEPPKKTRFRLITEQLANTVGQVLISRFQQDDIIPFQPSVQSVKDEGADEEFSARDWFNDLESESSMSGSAPVEEWPEPEPQESNEINRESSSDSLADL